jgi:hypothetical protein
MQGVLGKNAVLMTLPDARFSVRTYLQDFGDPTKIPPLEEVSQGISKPINMLMAHSARATIVLNDDGQVTVNSSALGTSFVTEKDCSYTLTFDNDCEQTKEDRNDMDMFYEVIEEHPAFGDPNRRFRIGGVGQPAHARVEPPNFAAGKPCMFVKASKPGDLP